jgi:hypothetical protein
VVTGKTMLFQQWPYGKDHGVLLWLMLRIFCQHWRSQQDDNQQQDSMIFRHDPIVKNYPNNTIKNSTIQLFSKQLRNPTAVSGGGGSSFVPPFPTHADFCLKTVNFGAVSFLLLFKDYIYFFW